MIVRKNPFEPTSLFFSEALIDQSWLVVDNELFATTVTPKGAQPHAPDNKGRPDLGAN